MFVVMNKDKWNALPPDVQKIIEKVNEEYIEKQGKTWMRSIKWEEITPLPGQQNYLSFPGRKPEMGKGGQTNS